MPSSAEPESAKSRNTASEQESSRFYQPQTVRFFDPVAASADQGEALDSPEQPHPRHSSQLSPELKAAILRIDEQRRQMQQEEKPAEKKKRGFRKAKPARRRRS